MDLARSVRLVRRHAAPRIGPNLGCVRSVEEKAFGYRLGGPHHVVAV